jgi:NAD(P)-dependent dehydrogenase (short-subunit alcohol dehydrogenase family)
MEKHPFELFSLKEKTAIVTGGTGLIGKKHCEALALAGANVVVADISAENSRAFAETLGKNCIGLGMDVTKSESLENAKNTIITHFGTIDILVNNAAINDMFENPEMASELSAFEKYPIDSFRKSLEVNVLGVFSCSQVFGSIINVASTYGMVGPDQNIYKNEAGEQTFFKSPSYPTTKGAIINFTRYLAAYWGKRGVRVNTLSPGGVENSQDEFFVQNYSAKTLLGRMAQMADYQGAIIFLASDASAYMTGANLVVDGGWTAI